MHPLFTYISAHTEVPLPDIGSHEGDTGDEMTNGGAPTCSECATCHLVAVSPDASKRCGRQRGNESLALLGSCARRLPEAGADTDEAKASQLGHLGASIFLLRRYGKSRYGLATSP